MKNEIVLFTDGDVNIEVQINPEQETVWLTQKQMEVLFDVKHATVSEHISNILVSGELDETSVGFSDRSTGGRKPKIYNLDMILSVGYRVNSKIGIAFRKWANNVLKQFILQGYAINEKRLQALKKTVDIQSRMLADALDIEEKDVLRAVNEYTVNDSIKFDTKDYGGFQKSPIGNKFSDKFVLFSILCQINFLIYGVERWIKEETPTKLRFMYLLYYSLLELLPQINQKLNTAFKMDCSWESRDFRNSMAHYKLGVALKKEELVLDDLLFGLTIKYFGVSYVDVKNVMVD